MAGVGHGELVDGGGPDRFADIAEAVIQRPAADGRAQGGVAVTAEGGQPLGVAAGVLGAEQGLALGDPQRVRRAPER